jgi:hypothetical protein
LRFQAVGWLALAFEKSLPGPIKDVLFGVQTRKKIPIEIPQNFPKLLDARNEEKMELSWQVLSVVGAEEIFSSYLA